MAYENFIGAVESKKLLKERDLHLVLADHCTREWEGEIKKQGDKVVIKGLGSPTLYMMTKNGTYTTVVGTGATASSDASAKSGKDIVQGALPNAEEINGYEVELPVNQLYAWNFKVGDIDEQLSSEKGIVNKMRPKTAKKLATEQDKYVAKVIYSYTPSQLYGSLKLSSKATPSTNYTYILDYIDEVVMKAGLNNIADSETLYAEVSPYFFRCLNKALNLTLTNNVETVKGRKVADYNGIKFYTTNCVTSSYTSASSCEDYAIVRTGDSVAFFDPKTENEAYRPEGGFADAIKGFSLFDCGIVDPKGIFTSKIIAYEF